MEVMHKNIQRIEALDDFIKVWLTLKTPNEKKALYEAHEALLKAVKPIDIFYLHSYKQETLWSIDDIKESANRMVNFFYHGLQKHALTSHAHPFVQALLKENDAILDFLNHVKTLVKDGIEKKRDALINAFEACLLLERKFQKKEHILFPAWEDKLPSLTPLQVMWSLHDDARALLKRLLRALNDKTLNAKRIGELIGDYYYLIYGIIQKERLILYPVGMPMLDEKTLNKMEDNASLMGYTFIEHVIERKNETFVSMKDDTVTLPSGTLNLHQLVAILNQLPLDITFVDHENRVCYFNQRSARHFPRNVSILGRLVEHCHPPKSIDTVKQIVEAFKSGEKDHARFYIPFQKYYLLIDYYALKDAHGTYLGILETSQDIQELKTLEGEKRLLDW